MAKPIDTQTLENGNNVYSALRRMVLDEMTIEHPPEIPVTLAKFPQYDGKFFARILPLPDYHKLRKLFRPADYDMMHPTIVAAACVAGIVDDEGLPVFMDEDRERIEKLGRGGFYEDLSMAVLIANGYVDQIQQDKINVKNSETTGS